MRGVKNSEYSDNLGAGREVSLKKTPDSRGFSTWLTEAEVQLIQSGNKKLLSGCELKPGLDSLPFSSLSFMGKHSTRKLIASNFTLRQLTDPSFSEDDQGRFLFISSLAQGTEVSVCGFFSLLLTAFPCSTRDWPEQEISL